MPGNGKPDHMIVGQQNGRGRERVVADRDSLFEDAGNGHVSSIQRNAATSHDQDGVRATFRLQSVAPDPKNSNIGDYHAFGLDHLAIVIARLGDKFADGVIGIVKSRTAGTLLRST